MQIRKFRPDIEVLRAIAVLAVVISHSKIALASGFIGVDIFFVISGFLITKHLHDEVQKNGTVSIAGFYARRILRILPASVFVVLMTVLAFLIWLSPLQTINYGWDALISSLSGMNYRLAVIGTDYFNSTSLPTPFQHFWSLAVEEQFYFIWPLLILIVAKIFIRKPKNALYVSDPKYVDLENENQRIQAFEKEFAVVNFLKFKIVVTFILVLIIASSLYLSYSITLQSQPWAYFGLHTRAWQLAVGSLLAFYTSTFAKIPNRVAAILSWLGFAGLIAGFIIINEKTIYPGLWSLIPTLSTALIVLAGINETKYSFENLFNCRPVRWIGKISYSWYLVHWPLFVIFFYTIGDSLSILQKLGLIILSFLIANLTFLLVENPIRFATWIKVSYKRTFALGLLLILISAGASYSVVYIKTESLKNYDSDIEVVQNILDEKILIQRIKQGLNIKSLPFGLKIPVDFAASDYRFECKDDWLEVAPTEKNRCVLGNIKSLKTIALVGDSHAQQWIEPLENFAKKYDYKIVTFTKASCTLTDIKLFDTYLNRDYPECNIWSKEVFKQLEVLKPDIIIANEEIYPNSTPEKFEEYVLKLKTLAQKVIKIEDNPRSQIYIPECLSKNSTEVQKCNFKTKEGVYFKEQADKESEIMKKLNINFIKTLDWFCVEDQCPAIISNIIVYMDSNHITKSYAQYLNDILEQKLIDAIPKIKVK
jgi:peptidoglycan/LPS O-acetylase OafA/YrhL